jgi:diguanylate cyclase (GGDEF)-like protein
MSVRALVAAGTLSGIASLAALSYMAVGLQHDAPRTAETVVDGTLLPLAVLREATRMLNHVSEGIPVDAASRGDVVRIPDAMRDSVRLQLSDIERTLGQAAGQTRPSVSEEIEVVRDKLRLLLAADDAVTLRRTRNGLGEVATGIEMAATSITASAKEAGRTGDEAADRSVRILGMAASGVLGVLLFVAWAQWRFVVAPIRRAARVAASVAEGRLDEEIEVSGYGETLALTRSIEAVRIGTIEKNKRNAQLQTSLSNAYDGKLAIQAARFEAALNNMSQALCLFDRDLKLVVYNKGFENMFGPRELGMSPERTMADPQLRLALVGSSAGSFVVEAEDGRVLSVSRRGVVGGGLVVTMEDITEKHHADERMRHLARNDALTDLPNRVQFHERLTTSGGNGRIAVLSLDLDGFKAVNDSLGHPVGDALLRMVSLRLRHVVGKDRLVARMGGDEFAVILDGSPSEIDAEKIARRLVETVNEPYDVDGHRITVGVSIGIVFNDERGLGEAMADAMIREVDLALYEAKANGRNRWCFFEQRMSDQLRKRREMEADLRLAMERGELQLYYQPFFEAHGESISGFEALMRWHHPERGMVSPAEFIPIAEETGMIAEFGLWALRTACAEAAGWPDHLTVSVNVSPVQFGNGDLVRDVLGILVETGLAGCRLQLEVTESLMIEDTDTDGIVAILEAFRAAGILIAMDDFGTGYSSLGYLTRFPFDKVKIDQSFVRNLSVPRNMAVVRSIIGLGRGMDISIIAEGVETAEQYAVLRAEGCGEMQGYLFGRPLPASEIPIVLSKSIAGSLAPKSNVVDFGQARALG